MKMAQGTPESEFSIECFRNYTAPEVFIQGLAGIVDQQDVESMIRAQKQMLQRFEKTNEMLTNCNALSASRLKTAGAEFRKHTSLLVEMKKDLDYIFKKIRIIKSKLSTQYPQAFAEALRSSLAEEANENEVDNSPETSDKKIENISTPVEESDNVEDGNKAIAEQALNLKDSRSTLKKYQSSSYDSTESE